MLDVTDRKFSVRFAPDNSLPWGNLFDLRQDSTGNFTGTLAVKGVTPVTGVVHPSGQIEFDAELREERGIEHFAGALASYGEREFLWMAGTYTIFRFGPLQKESGPRPYYPFYAVEEESIG